MGSRRKRSRDDDGAEHQAKRMKSVLNISSDSIENGGDSDKESGNVGTAQTATRNISIVLRFPNEERHCLQLNDVCQLKILFDFIQSHGLDPASHVLRMLYPKRDYTLEMRFSTLGSLNFFPQELIHVNRVL